MSDDTLRAAGEVIAARLAILASAAADPANADFAEIRLMSAEKIEALTASGAVLADRMAAEGDRFGESIMDETRLGLDVARRMSTAGSPGEALAVHAQWAVGWWGRASARALLLNAAALEAQQAAFEPIRRAALDNAERLKP